MQYRDADLIRKIGEVTAIEVRASGAHYAFAPCVAVSHMHSSNYQSPASVLLHTNKCPPIFVVPRFVSDKIIIKCF